MKIKEAKENVIENFRRLNYPDHHEIEVFLLNTLEQFEGVVKDDCKRIINKWKNEGDPTETDLVLENILKELR